MRNLELVVLLTKNVTPGKVNPEGAAVAASAWEAAVVSCDVFDWCSELARQEQIARPRTKK